MLLRCAVCIVCLIAPSLGHTQLDKHLKKSALHIWQTNAATFFCQQSFDEKGKLLKSPCPDCASVKQNVKWMPIVPPEVYAQGRLCYEEKACFDEKGNHFGGIRCCQKIDSFFQKMEKDLQNYVPENIEISRHLRKFHYGSVTENISHDFLCGLKIDPQSKIFEPADSLKGPVARSILYMHYQYQVPLTEPDKLQYYQWHQAYPPSQAEKLRNQRIGQIHGQQGNPLILAD